MRPTYWFSLAAAACLLPTLLPMGEPVVVYSLVAGCFATATEDDSTPAPSEDADDEPGDELPSALTPRRAGPRGLCPNLETASQVGRVALDLTPLTRVRPGRADKSHAPSHFPLRC